MRLPTLEGDFFQWGKIELMVAIFPDNHPKMEALHIVLWRSASPTRKMEMLA